MVIIESGLEACCIVAIRFPFSDLSRAKLRPALILVNVGKGDYLMCQITSKSYADSRAIIIEADDFAIGQLPLTSFARPGKLFTAHESLFQKPLGKINRAKHEAVVRSVCDLLRC